MEPWSVIFPDFDGSVALRGARKREGLTQVQLARLADIHQSHLSAMENGKRPIGKTLARRLGTILKVDYRVFL